MLDSIEAEKMKAEGGKKINGWQFAALEEVSEVVSKGTTPTTLGHDFSSVGIPFLRAEDVTGGAVNFRSVAFHIPQKTHELLSRSQLQPGDFLITIAGTLGRVGYVPHGAPSLNCNQAVAFARLNPSRINLKYANLICQSSDVMSPLLGLKKVGTIGNLNLEQVRGLQIPLPSLVEQKRIAAILDKADRLRRTRRYAQQLSDTFLQSVFVEMFGDVVKNPRGWEVVKLESLGELDRGKSQHRPRNAPHLFGGEYPFVQTGDVANSSGYVRNYKQTYSEAGLQQSRFWSRGTLCITIAANIAKTGVLTFNACFPDSIVGFTPNEKTNTEFVQQWFSFKQKNLEETAPESAQKNINLEILRGLDVPLPPIDLQERFALTVQRFERLRAQQREAARQAEHLFQTLLHRAFRGEL